MRKQAERMADTFGLDTMEQLLAKVERRGGEQEMCVVCGFRRPARGLWLVLYTHVNGILGPRNRGMQAIR